MVPTRRYAGRRRGVCSAAAAILLAVAAGCGGQSGEASFQVADIRAHRDCLESGFPFQPTFFTARERIDSVGVFVKNRASLDLPSNTVYFEFFEPERLVEAPDAVSFEYPTRADSPVRGEVALETSCPDLNVSWALRGRVRVDRLDTSGRGRIKGELVEGTLVDARSEEVVAGSITGSWSFRDKRGSPWEFFTQDRDEYPSEP